MLSASNVEVWLVIGFGFGLVSFFRGFKIFREYRILEDTPEVPIRSIAMGLVHIHGKAEGEQQVASPVTQTPCYFYKVNIERYQRSSRGSGSWRHYKTDADGVLFYLTDATGKVLVDGHRAECDLMQTCKRETGGLSLGGLRTLFGGAKNPVLPAGAFVDDESLISYAESLATGGGASLSSMLGGISVGSGLSLGLGGGSSRRYRFTEYCILRDHWYDVTGTCVENPSATEEHDRNLIQKGENEPTFLISWRSEKNVESSLRNQAALHIFGGGALAVACLAILLARLGWL